MNPEKFRTRKCSCFAVFSSTRKKIVITSRPKWHIFITNKRMGKHSITKEWTQFFLCQNTQSQCKYLIHYEVFNWSTITNYGNGIQDAFHADRLARKFRLEWKSLVQRETNERGKYTRETQKIRDASRVLWIACIFAYSFVPSPKLETGPEVEWNDEILYRSSEVFEIPI